MNDHDAVEVTAVPPQDSGLSVRGLWQVFSSPTQIFQKLKDQPIPAHENYRRFAERFFRRLEEERGRVCV